MNTEVFSSGTLTSQSQRNQQGTLTVSASLDGVMTPMKDGQRQAKREQAQAEGKRPQGPAGYQEVGCGTVSFYNAAGERLQTRRLGRILESRKQTLKRQLQAEMAHILNQQPELKVVAIADGAKDNWTFLDRAFPNATAVADFFHAADHGATSVDRLSSPSGGGCKATVSIAHGPNSRPLMSSRSALQHR